MKSINKSIVFIILVCTQRKGSFASESSYKTSQLKYSLVEDFRSDFQSLLLENIYKKIE
jgi:hypothetical protein